MPKITEMYAFVAIEDGPDDEGIMATKVDDYWFPMVGADMKSIESWKRYADQMKVPYKIKKFKLVEENG